MLLHSTKTLEPGSRTALKIWNLCFTGLLRSTKTLEVGTQTEFRVWHICLIPLLHSTKTFLRGREQRRQRPKLICFRVRLRFKRNTRAKYTVQQVLATLSKALGSHRLLHLLPLLVRSHHFNHLHFLLFSSRLSPWMRRGQNFTRERRCSGGCP